MTNKSGHLYLVRHGQTPSNIDHKLDTALPGAPLTSLGQQQAAEVGAELRNKYSIRPVKVLHSHALRAQQTAVAIARECAVNPEPLADLHEIQAGDLEMRNDPSAYGVFYHSMQEWFAGRIDVELPGGESAADVVARSSPAIEEIRSGQLESGNDVVVVSHGATIRIVGVMLGVVEGHFALHNDLRNCAIVDLSITDSGSWQCHRWGENMLEP